MVNKILLTILIVVVLIGGGYYYVRSQQTAPSSPQQESKPEATDDNQDAMHSESASEESKESGETMMDEGVKSFTVEGKNFAFNPSTITVKKGDKVKITFTSVGGFHDFVIDEFNVSTKQLSTGQTETVEFTADKAGTYEYYCSVGNHRAMGMVGKLIVQ